MVLNLPLADLMGVLAGALIICVGLFVLIARPNSILHRLFFVLALFDGMSTLLFQLSYMLPEAGAQLYFHGLYWYHYIAFLVLLLWFGLMFPRPFVSRRISAALVAGVVLAGLALLALYALRHDLFWTQGRQSGGFFVNGPWGNAVTIAFVATTGLLVAKLTSDFLHLQSASHRRQSAFVLGGMTLAYAPYAATLVVQAIGSPLDETFLSPRLDRALAYWSFLLLCSMLAGSAILLLRNADSSRGHDRRFVLGCYAGVLAISLVALVVPTPLAGWTLRTLALLAYPILLGYAIARYEVFDIDRRLRRAATVTFVAVGASATFIVAENAVESLLQERVFGGFSSDFAAGSTAALATAAIAVPLVKASRRISRRVVPELTVDELHARKLEIYAHSLEGAYEDGILAERESRTLTALRESLGITQQEHDDLLAVVRARRQQPPQDAAALAA